MSAPSLSRVAGMDLLFLDLGTWGKDGGPVCFQMIGEGVAVTVGIARYARIPILVPGPPDFWVLLVYLAVSICADGRVGHGHTTSSTSFMWLCILYLFVQPPGLLPPILATSLYSR